MREKRRSRTSKRGVDEAEKPAIMGGSLGRKRRALGKKALRPIPKFFESMRRYLVKAPAGRMIVHLADV